MKEPPQDKGRISSGDKVFEMGGFMGDEYYQDRGLFNFPIILGPAE